MALTVGSRLGHYDVTALIGEGGMVVKAGVAASELETARIIWFQHWAEELTRLVPTEW